MTKRRVTANIFGVLGYLFVLLSWLWAAVLFLTSTSVIEDMTRSHSSASYPDLALPTISVPEPLTAVMLFGMTILMIGLSLYAIYKAPKEFIARTSSATRTVAKQAAPLVHRTLPPSKTKRALLTARLVFYIKLALSLLPMLIVGGIVALLNADLQLAPELAVIAASAVSLLTVVCFGVQYAVAWLLKVPCSLLI